MKREKGIYSPLYTDLYELTMAQGYFLEGKWSKRSNFDYFFRKMPYNGGYAVFAGLQPLLDVAANLSFDAGELAYLDTLGFKKEFLTYLESFRFQGSIFSVREGEIIFKNEPVLRVEGTILETQLLETVALNILNFQSLIATKASRMRDVAEARTLIDFGLRRAQGEGGFMASRAAIIGGFDSTSNVYSARQHGLEVAGTMAHAWIESFDSELAAFRKFAELYPDNSVLLVDTYDTLNSGIPNAIRVAHEMEKKGQQLIGVRLDSGDLAYMSKKARILLDEAGLPQVKIVVSNQLDEYLIKSLLGQGAPIDGFGVGTNLVVGRDDGALDGVYKLTMHDEKPRLKISDNPEKLLWPGVKKVCRYYDEEGYFHYDGVALHDEHEPVLYEQNLPMRKIAHTRQEELMIPVMESGKVTVEAQDPYTIARYVSQRKQLLREEYKRLENPHRYRVGIGGELQALRLKLLNDHKIITDSNESTIDR